MIARTNQNEEANKTKQDTAQERTRKNIGSDIFYFSFPHPKKND